MVKEYFSHDYNTRSDLKIKKLLARLDYLGYGLWWAILEELYKNGNAMSLDYESLAYDFRTSTEIIQSILTEFDLFVISDDRTSFSSDSVARRLAKRNEISESYRKRANARWQKEKDTAPGMQQHNTSNANNKKENKTKGKKIKEKEKVFVPPALSEFVDYFVSNGFKVDVAHRAWKGYDAAKWHDTSGKPVLNWKQKCQNVWFTDENKMPVQGLKPMVH